MKTIAYLIAFIIASFSAQSQNITVSVDNVLNNKGKVIFALHTADTFMKGPGIKNGESVISEGQAAVIFENVKPGIYAIMVLHDENENNQMDFRTDGMPKEHYGVSNNPMSFGPPQFADAKFDMKADDLYLKIRF